MKRFILALMLLASSALAHAGEDYATIYSTYVPNTSVSSGTGQSLGTAFTPKVSGHVVALRFYKAASGDGSTSRTLKLWKADGTEMASITTANEVAGAWNTFLLPQRHFVEEGANYVVSYFMAANQQRRYWPNLYQAGDRVFDTIMAESTINGVSASTGSHVFPSIVSGTGNAFAVDVYFVPGYESQYE